MILRPYKPCDAGAIVSWCRDEDVFLKWSGGRFGAYPITAEDINRKYFAENGDCVEADNFYPMTACEDGPVGHLILRYVNGDRTVIRLGWVIVDSAQRGKGIGRRMLTLALNYAFTTLGAEKVTIGVFAANTPAHRCYKSTGFRETKETHTEEIQGAQWQILELEMTREVFLRR